MDVALSAYAVALDYLFARTTGSFRFGLERTRSLLTALGDPQRSYPVLHIAGTNGKGSAVATAEALLRAKGLRVGCYTSPHLVDFRERIVVGGIPMAEEDVVRFIEEWLPVVERVGASFFEATTAMALHHFAQARVDVALLETGLGGRLDSTNVVMPRAAGVTSIGLDHMEYLGSTLKAIAAEKAGIFKAGVPAVIGEPDVQVRAWLADGARRAGASSIRVIGEEMCIDEVKVSAAGTRFRLVALGDERTIHTPLIGLHQATNLAFTLGLLDAAGDPFRVSLEEAAANLGAIRLPGRFQRVGRWIFDVAHNADSARTLAGSIAALEHTSPVVILLGVLGDKDWRAMMDALAPVADLFILTSAPTAPPSRAWSVSHAAAYAGECGYAAETVADFDAALARAESTGATVLVTGSFHTVGDAMTRLQLSPLSL